jgi:hypothetical protein
MSEDVFFSFLVEKLVVSLVIRSLARLEVKLSCHKY